MDFQYWTRQKIVTKLSYVWHKKRGPETSTDFHLHPTHELIIVDHGSLEVSVYGISHLLGQGACIYIPRCTMHRVVPRQQSVNFINILYRGREMPELHGKLLTLSREALDVLPRLLSVSTPPLNVCKSELAACRLSELLLLLGGMELSAPETVSIPAWNKHNYRSGKTRLILDYLGKHFSEKVTAEQLSDLSGLSQSHLRTLFKKETGLSFTVHLQNLRIAEAKKQLLKSNLSIGEIAVRSGFPSLPFFFQVFKKHTGMTPQEYAKSFGDTENI